MSTYFLTGGSGFIGGHLAEELTARGHNVRCLVRKTSNRELLESVGVEFVEGSLADSNVLAEAVKDVDYVVHLAHMYVHAGHQMPPIDAREDRVTYALKSMGVTVLSGAASICSRIRILN